MQIFAISIFARNNKAMKKECEECGSPAGKRCYDNCPAGGFNLIEWLAEAAETIIEEGDEE